MATRETSYIDKLHGSAEHVCCNLGQGYMFLETMIAVKLHEKSLDLEQKQQLYWFLPADYDAKFHINA